MTRREKIDAAIAFLRSRRVSASSAAPPLYRLLWSLGIYVPPPHFQSFLGLALILGTVFGTIMGVVFSLTTLGDRSWEWGAIAGLFCGVFFGLSMAAYFRWSASKLKLPRWSEFVPPNRERREDQTR